jgi:hypothetical protein
MEDLTNPETDIKETEVVNTDELAPEQTNEPDEEIEIVVDEDSQTPKETEGNDGEEVEGEEGGDIETEKGTEGEKPKEEGNVEQNKKAEENAELSKLKQERDDQAKRNAKMESLMRDTLKKLGVNKEGNLEEILEQTAAEAEGISVEEYRKKRQSEEETALAKEQLKQQAINALFTADLAELKKNFPDLAGINHISEIENFKEFGRLRDSGVSVRNAYIAANPDKFISNAVKAVVQKTASGSKAHLKSAIGKSAGGAPTVTMTKSQLEYWKGIFPDKTNAEIAKLYRDTL